MNYNVNISQNDNSALFSALLSKNLDVIKYLLDNGADVKARASFAFYHAAQQMSDDCFKLLWEHGHHLLAFHELDILVKIWYQRADLIWQNCLSVSGQKGHLIGKVFAERPWE